MTEESEERLEESEECLEYRIQELAESYRNLAGVFKRISEGESDPNNKWYSYGLSVAYQEVSERIYGILEYMEKGKVKE